MHIVPEAIEPDRFEDALRELSTRVTRIYLHVDLDALDVSQARANQYAAAGGPTLERLSHCIRMACERFPRRGSRNLPVRSGIRRRQPSALCAAAHRNGHC